MMNSCAIGKFYTYIFLKTRTYHADLVAPGRMSCTQKRPDTYGGWNLVLVE